MAIRFLDEQPRKTSTIKFVDTPNKTETPEEPSFLKRLTQVATGQEEPTVLGAAQAPLFLSQRLGAQALEAVQTGADIAGEKVAETLGQRGVPPTLAAGLGTGVSLTPDLLLSAAGGGAGRNIGKAVSRALSPKQLGKELGKLESQAGIEQLASSKRRVAAELGLPETAEVGDVINAVNAIRQQGGRLAPQLAKDLKIFFRANLGRIRDNTTQALGRAAESFADDMLNLAVPGREAVAKAFGRAASLRKGLGTAGRAARNIGIGAAGIGGTAALLRALGGGGQ